MIYTEYLQKHLHKFESKPAKESEIEKIEVELGLIFPLAFKNFLLLTGNDFNELMNDTGTCYLKDLLSNRKAFDEEMLSEGIIYNSQVIVFACMDNYLLLLLDGSDDPPVWCYSPQLYNEGDAFWPGYSSLGYQQGFFKHADSFSEFLVKVIDNYDNEMNSWK
jgi:SMI1 / KNR4 family (SUKH-1)